MIILTAYQSDSEKLLINIAVAVESIILLVFQYVRFKKNK